MSPQVPSQHAAPVWLRASLRALSVVAPAAAGRLGAEIFCTPRTRRIRASERELLAGAERRLVRSRDLDLVVHVWGDGPLVLLHHGWSGHGAQMTAFVSVLRARGFAVAAIDAAAHGASSGTRNNLVWMTTDAVAVAHALRPVAFVGHSMGAVVGVRAARAGIAFERLVLLAPPAEFEPYFVAFARAVGLTDRAFACMIERFRAQLGTRFDELTAEWLSAGALPPALVVCDDADEDAPPAHAHRWVERWLSRVEAMRTSGLGHRAILRDRAVIERVAEFLSAR